ncbi:MAG: metalloregulator ArsR/SmtB family transcription factor [Cellvibrionaceae bacterium]
MNTAIESTFTSLAAFNKAAGDAFRLEVLRVLAQDAYGVMELSQIFDYRQSGMSHHLKVLAEAGLVIKRREGNSIFYSRALPAGDSGLSLLQQQLYFMVDEIALSEEVSARVDVIKRERAAQSQAFFEQHAEQFKEQQDLIADYPTYGDAVNSLLERVMAKESAPEAALAVEIGPGEGEFLPVLSGHFERVIALDNAATMLAHAQKFCEQQQLNNISFECNDTRFFQSENMGDKVDCIAMNMVLHHTPSPADIFKDSARGLKEKGVLIVTELCRHDQDWAKEACGDLWLGFDPSEMQQWASAAGLKHGHSHYFALRNGFQIQLQQFYK